MSATQRKRSKRPRAVPAILPREPLTKKARAAIVQYVIVRCGEAKILDFAVKYTLEAERMRRADLYAWLEQHGYSWIATHGAWFAADAAVSIRSRKKARGEQ